MKLVDILESPIALSDTMTKTTIAKNHKDNAKKYFVSLMSSNSDWGKKVKHLTLKRINNNYILIDDEKKELYYGLNFMKFNDGITVKWMENYSNVKGLTELIFTQIIKYDNFTDIIYSGDSHTPENIELHKKLNKFKQLKVEVWDDKLKKITNDNPYSGIYANSKQFRFSLLENIDSDFNESENIISIYLQEGYEKTKENLDHDLEFFICCYFVEY